MSGLLAQYRQQRDVTVHIKRMMISAEMVMTITVKRMMTPLYLYFLLSLPAVFLLFIAG
jgi:hypothetical protein